MGFISGAHLEERVHRTPAAHLSGEAMPNLANALLASGVIDRWTKSWGPRKQQLKTKRRILETAVFRHTVGRQCKASSCITLTDETV